MGSLPVDDAARGNPSFVGLQEPLRRGEQACDVLASGSVEGAPSLHAAGDIAAPCETRHVLGHPGLRCSQPSHYLHLMQFAFSKQQFQDPRTRRVAQGAKQTCGQLRVVERTGRKGCSWSRQAIKAFSLTPLRSDKAL